ncbi:T9SS type A sorting domain-containing protein [Mucilaginibacter sp.]|uniref:alpha/beta hydrolase n=1 Tax=Mucilaginibacter sp. TaxID=1882438 RepID=UPI003B000F1D
MKKILLFVLVILASLTVRSQTLKDYTQTADSCFSNLNKSGITTGILYDRIYPLAALPIFNQNYADTSSKVHLIQAYSELFYAAYSNAGMIIPDTLSQRITNKLNYGIVPIGILNYRFNYIDTTAINNNLLTTSGMLFYDVANRPRSPYLERLVSVAAVLTDTITTNSPYFELSSSLYFNNTSNAIANLNVDFGDGTGLHTIGLGQGTSINYSSSGVKTVHYYINYSNGTQVETYSTIYVNISSTESRLAIKSPTPQGAPTCNGFNNPHDLPRIIADIGFQGYEKENTTTKGEGVATIVYHTNTCDQMLRKPIIIINGFNPGSRNDITYLHNNLYYNNNLNNFGDEMLAKGYDVIFLKFPTYNKNGVQIDGGADYIQRNAFTLITLIQKVNQILQQNGSTEKLVVIGPSMGGLISRYALKYMEDHNMPHNTRLWVSFDSPHLGANIPIGDQFALDYLGNVLHIPSAKEKINSTINSPAAKEMLLDHYIKPNQQPLPTPYGTRNSFMQELNSLGFPSQLRKIALINGAGNGLTQGNFGSLNLNVAIVPTTLTRFIGTAAVGFIYRAILIKVVQAIAVAAGITLDAAKAVNMYSYFSPGYNGYNKVFSGTLFGIFLKRTDYGATYNNSIGLDNISGGYYNTQQQIVSGIQDGLHGAKGWFLRSMVYTLIPTHSFIPAKSSLAVTNGSNYGEDFSNRNLVTSSETPFNTYFTPNKNENHVSLTVCSAQWLANEIDQQPQAPVIATRFSVNGLASICNAQPYSVTNLPAGSSVTWTANPSSLVNITVSNNVATLTPAGNGSITLTAAIPTTCGTLPVSFTVNVNTSPTVTSISATMSGSCRSGGYQDWLLQATPSNPNATNWRWTASNLSSGSTITFQSPNSPSTYATVHGGGGANITYTDPCGNTANGGVTIYSPCGTGSRVASYPNPADQEMTVDYQTASDSSNPAATSDAGTQSKTLNSFSVELYNDKGKVLKSGKSNNGKGVVLNTADVQNGNYFLHV